MTDDAMRTVLEQIAHGNGLEAENLASKWGKQELCYLGYVWPMYGSRFHLTPAGKQYAESKGIEVAPFAWLNATELRKRAEACWDTEWDREQGEAWLLKAIPQTDNREGTP